MIFDRRIRRKLLSIALFCLSIKSVASTTNEPPLLSKQIHSTNWTTFVKTLKNANSKKSIQLGGFIAHQGNAQDININGLIGDHFSVTKHNDSSGLVGVGYYLDGQEINGFNLSYGINAFYLAKTGVSGLVTQEQLFTNLGYHYSITNYPIYLGTKALIKNNRSNKYNFTLDAGVGPNIITTSSVTETSLDGTIPDNTYSGRTTATFSAMVGVGIQMNNIFGRVPLECGYRFLYLGKESFNKLSDQLINRLNTGNSYANILLCTLTI